MTYTETAQAGIEWFVQNIDGKRLLNDTAYAVRVRRLEQDFISTLIETARDGGHDADPGKLSDIWNKHVEQFIADAGALNNAALDNVFTDSADKT